MDRQLAGRGLISTIDDGSGTGHGRSTCALNTVKSAVTRPMPSVRMRTTLALKTG